MIFESIRILLQEVGTSTSEGYWRISPWPRRTMTSMRRSCSDNVVLEGLDIPGVDELESLDLGGDRGMKYMSKILSIAEKTLEAEVVKTTVDAAMDNQLLTEII
jgi:hypothetical protein